jgi:hypothetical protein
VCAARNFIKIIRNLHVHDLIIRPSSPHPEVNNVNNILLHDPSFSMCLRHWDAPEQNFALY